MATPYFVVPRVSEIAPSGPVLRYHFGVRPRLHSLAVTASRVAVLAVLFTLPVAAGVGCIDPKGRLDAYIEETKSLRGAGNASASDASVSADGGTFSGDYFGICLPSLAGGDMNLTLRFRVTVDSTGDAIKMKLQCLPEGSTTTGAAIGPVFPDPQGSGALVEGKFNVTVGSTPGLPASCNALTHLDWGLDNLAIDGALTAPPERFCAGLSGKTRPSGLAIDKSKDFCLFYRVSGPDQQVTLPQPAEFTCPIGS